MVESISEKRIKRDIKQLQSVKKCNFKMLNNKMLKIIFSILIIFFSISNLFADETYILNWEKLVPKNAYDFIPKDGGSDELWQNKNFLKKIDIAGLKINKNLVGKKISDPTSLIESVKFFNSLK